MLELETIIKKQINYVFNRPKTKRNMKSSIFLDLSWSASFQINIKYDRFLFFLSKSFDFSDLQEMVYSEKNERNQISSLFNLKEDGRSLCTIQRSSRAGIQQVP